ncbi:iron-containing alcohol dehydrogenase [Clostridium algidicarnis]|jgi:alcohol dehydrogenase class IV|uniref:Alcohol dehydrogenase class IV n=2 Tax=Clostridium algidicarnis TaxID=37659 RepID=A0A2S6G0C4_9CLOT|nr:iron-containing alcohol dehydrogenase [Clostridium algidicarnis]MBU3220323.1 iron-containing alcohol dehydrogenase [Clostridium algidicarnis]PPK49343.1 alcohol dehydrogenase class IV [Clostridium algidicarnis DSM 15099]
MRFTIPRDVYFGKDAVDEIKNLKGKKAMVVIGGNSVKKNGALDKVMANLKEANIETRLFEGVEHDPSVQTVKKGTKIMQEFQPDWIIGIGGGSPIDAAKAMWIFYEHPELTFEEAAKPFSLPELRNKARFLAVTTTSGTATEVTSFSVITDNETGIKYPIADYNLTPDIAIVDTELVQTLPTTLVAHTGMDVLTHAIEAYVSTASNPITDAVAIKAIEMVGEDLIDSYHENPEARGNMHIAQNLAGMAFSNAILGIVHSMAHKSGVIFDIPHGCINAIYLPYVIRFNAKTAPKKYVEIAKRLNLAGDTEEALVNSLIKKVQEMNIALNIPATLKDYGIEEATFLSNLDSIAEIAVQDPCTGTNPREISVEEMKELYTFAYYGK